MTIAKRYCTKVHGFAATKQADFRDIPWYSVDSITWKTCEMYGSLIHWDKHNQKLMFLEKHERVQVKQQMKDYGFNADAIVADKDYKEVTRYALFSMRAMEEFYEKKYKDRIFYYELRMPHPVVIMKVLKDDEVENLWELMRPEKLFKGKEKEKNVYKLRKYLASISAIQHRLDSYVTSNPFASEFLTEYFPRLMQPSMVDMGIFQKEIANYIAPPNPPALARIDATHYIPSQNVPKKRDVSELTLKDLEHDPASVPLLLDEIE
jgi:hypothetical protein